MTTRHIAVCPRRPCYTLPMDRDKPLLVIGHKNPDTDSICSAIGYARFKNDVLGESAQACRAGSINAQTRYALDHFSADDPVLLPDVLPRIRDIMIPHDALYLVRPEQPLSEAYRVIIDNRFSFLPVTDDDDRCIGRITSVGLAGLLERLAGSTVERLLSTPVAEFLEPVGPTFTAATTIRDAERTINRYNEGGFVVTNEAGKIAGVVTRVNFMTDSRFRIALVDHNEFSQSAEGIEFATVEEIIDHHRIGLHRTNEPITVVNHVVGSTCTIVANMYRQRGAEPPSQLAGLLLSGLLSDTVVLNSPTTTDLDRELAPWLAGIAGVEIETYGHDLFAAGSETNALSAQEIIGKDRKQYEEKGRRFTVSQVEMVGFEAFWRRVDELRRAVHAECETEELSFAALMVTDITTSTTLLLLDGPETLRSRIAYPEPEAGIFEMRGVLSRKKQVLPMLLEVM